MPIETTTPNIGLQIPGFDQANWQVPTNYNWNVLDQIFGGEIQVPGLNVVNLTVENFTIPNFAALLVAVSFQEALPSTGGTVFTLTHPAAFMIGLYVNGLMQRLGTDYVLSINTVTFQYTVPNGASVYAVYLRSA